MKLKNPKVVALSAIALILIVLTFTLHWLFIIPAVAIYFINKKELSKKNSQHDLQVD